MSRDPHRSQVDIFISLLVVIFVVLSDRLTKIFFSDFLSLGESFPVIKNILYMTLVHNTGIAFGLFKDQGLVFIVVPIIAIILLVFNIYYYRQNGEALCRTYIGGFSLILGGAIGNLYDRIVHGFVIDFINFRIWPVFNMADSAITIGAVIIAWKCLNLSKKEKTSNNK
ncbi:Lipoprotein signal peptidase [hydrothermal vent metagenome]|uniref:Lipoprotein signal peptidase n=1 Tax=hydrothermal vent metagenome TaxID=652676 RepID=A0A3B0TVM9_9ZZZZ